MQTLAGLVLGFGAAWFLFTTFWEDERDLQPLYDEEMVRAVFETAAPAVVEVRTVIQAGQRIGQGSGSGFFVDDRGHIITSSHVVEDADEVTVRLNDGRLLSAIRLGNSRHDDLAVLRVDPEEVSDIRPLTFADSNLVTPGEMAIAIGSPFERFNSVSVGVVSGIERSTLAPRGNGRSITGMIQTDAALNPGNSGGPLLNAEGEVLGVNSSVKVQSGLQIGVGFAVASNTVLQILDRLKEPGEFTRPWMGFRGVNVGDLRMETGQQLARSSGIYVTNVCDGGPAERAGIQDDYLSVILTYRISGRGDIITGVDGEPVETMPDLISYVNALEVGDRVTLNLVRNGHPVEAEVTLAEWEERCV